MNKFFYLFSIVLLFYMLWPGSSGISDFKALPDSAKSTLAGDSVQIPNVAAYFSNHYRDFVSPFYFKNYQENSHFLFPPIKLNHPPEYSWSVIKNPTDSTYLEEYVYPLRDSLYVNGLEMFNPDGSRIFYGAPLIVEEGKIWLTKTTLRLYTSNALVRLIVWLGIIISTALVFKLAGRIVKE